MWDIGLLGDGQGLLGDGLFDQAVAGLSGGDPHRYPDRNLGADSDALVLPEPDYRRGGVPHAVAHQIRRVVYAVVDAGLRVDHGHVRRPPEVGVFWLALRLFQQVSRESHRDDLHRVVPPTGFDRVAVGHLDAVGVAVPTVVERDVLDAVDGDRHDGLPRFRVCREELDVLGLPVHRAFFERHTETDRPVFRRDLGIEFPEGERPTVIGGNRRTDRTTDETGNVRDLAYQPHHNLLGQSVVWF